jgi:lipopolysaccharide/colanic/teichoic acid biosynthesis glycosyltransferase
MILGALIALSVILDSQGPVFYRARRVGQGGRDFEMLKFRTMTRDARGDGLRIKGDTRQTPLGRMLNLSHLDELPQLWNVLRGDMGIVGPRPEAREFVLQQPSDYAEILTLRPGLTGPTQLAFLDERARLARVPAAARREFYVEMLLPQKVASDLEYVRCRTVGWDVKLLAATALAAVAPINDEVRSPAGLLARITMVGAPLCCLAVLYAALVAAPVA